MPVGFQSFTDSGILQIDAEKKCYVLKEAASGTSDANNTFSLRIPLGINPIVFFHEDDGALRSVWVSSTQRTYNFYTNTPNQTVRWYIFDVISSSISNDGFKLYNSAGEITFDANQRPLVLHAAVGNVKPGTGASCSIDVSRDYAVSTPTVPLKSELVTSDTSNYFIPRPERSGSNLVFASWNYLGGASWGALVYDMAPVVAMVIDVTGIPTPVWAPPPPPAGYWQIIEGYNGGTAYGYDSNASPTYGSINGATTFGGATIKSINMGRSSIKGNPFITFGISMSGNRAQSFWTNVDIAGHGIITSASAGNFSYDAGLDVTFWGWLNAGFDVASIDGYGITEGIFT